MLGEEMNSKLLVSKNKILISIIVLILVIVGSLAFYTSYKTNNNPSKIIQSITNAKEYTADIEYTIKNSRGEFIEEAKIEHKNSESKLTFVEKEQFFSKDKIKINYFEGDKHFIVDRDYDEFYRFFLINELANYINEEGVKFTQKEDKMIIDFKTGSSNRNFTNAKFIVDLKKKEPISITIFDDKDLERVLVNYNNFSITKE